MTNNSLYKDGQDCFDVHDIEIENASIDIEDNKMVKRVNKNMLRLKLHYLLHGRWISVQ